LEFFSGLAVVSFRVAIDWCRIALMAAAAASSALRIHPAMLRMCITIP